ncbi:P-loop containing nucleoside triphosphate hydrolase protein, partial [Mycena alexandri]
WQSPQGHQTVSTIVKKRIPQWPNGLYLAQKKLIVRILDGEDIVCCMATGGGKSALFAVPIVVLLELARNPALYPDLPSRALPVGIVVTPTKGLAANIVLELKNLGVSALSYCHEMVTEARKTGRNLAREIGDCATWNVICVDPEHLRDKAWRDITANNIFRANIVYGCTDEAHLIRDWGAEFRPQFRHIGTFFRGRLPSSVSIMALSATILPGAPLKSICSSLGMSGDNFYLLRLSNERLNTQLILEPLENGVGGKVFPQLLAILNSGRKAIIHCRTIDDVLRVFLYLWKCLPPGPHRLHRLKTYHSLRSVEDNAEILRLLAEDPVCQVAIATVALANGLNVKPVLDSISIGCPETLEQMLQEKGRAGRDAETAARGYVLYQPSVLAAAEKQLDATSHAAPASNTTRKKAPAKPLQQAKVEFLTEKICLNAAVNRVFENPPLNISSLDCIAAERPLPCSLCAARNNIVLDFPAPPLPPNVYFPPFTAPIDDQQTTPTDKKSRLTQKERKQVEPMLIQFGETVRRAQRKLSAHANRPKSAFFPSSVQKSLLDSLLTFESFNDLASHVKSWTFAAGYQVRLYALVHELRTTIQLQREEAQEKKKGEGLRDDEASSESSDEEAQNHPRSSPIPPPPKRPRHALNEITNEERPARKPTKKAMTKR